MVREGVQRWGTVMRAVAALGVGTLGTNWMAAGRKRMGTQENRSTCTGRVEDRTEVLHTESRRLWS